MTVRPFDLAAKTQYHCRFMMEKTAAGTATPIITVRFGVAGTTADAALGTFTFSAQTAAVDSGMIEIWGTFRVVSATVARFACVGQISHNNQTTGLGTTGQETQRFESANFNSALASAKLGISVNGGTSAAWTVFLVHSQIIYPYS